MTAKLPRASDGDARRVALYISSLADELARLAKSNDLDTLAYILDMARLEADQVSKSYGSAVGRDRRAGGPS